MCIGCEYKYVVFSSSSLWGRRYSAIDGISCLGCLASGKCLCVFGKIVLWSIYFYVIILVPMLYLKLWNYIYRPSVVPSCSVRPSVPSSSSVPSSVPSSSSVSCPSVPSCLVVAVVAFCASVRPIVRPVVVVRPLSVRPSRCPSRCPSRRRSSVRPSENLSWTFSLFKSFSGDPSQSTMEHDCF